MAEYPVNRAKLKLTLGEVATLVLGQNTADMCDFLGQAGFDAMFIDGEHGPYNWGDLSGIARACELWDMAA
ncbi:MAG: 4-hydroxy-2-oxovalerate aldolase, partial [Dehalococcoidia bacterium]